jgi:uncharacterized protein YukE
MTLPSDDIYNALGFSAEALEKVIAGIKNPTDISRHRLLLPDDRDGLEDALFAYMIFMTENPLSGHSKKIKQALGDYNNAWSRLFDAVRESNSSLADTVKSVRDAQKKAHARLAEILESGNGDATEEFNALADALRDLSEAMGDSAKAPSNKNSLKGKKYNTYKIKVTKAAKLINESPAVLRKEAKSNKTLRLALDADTVEPLLTWAKGFKAIRGETKAAKKEVNQKNHAVPESCLGKRTKIKHGL